MLRRTKPHEPPPPVNCYIPPPFFHKSVPERRPTNMPTHTAVPRYRRSSPARHAPTEVGREWSLALLGIGCCTLGVACLLLVACSGTPSRPLPVVPPVTPRDTPPATPLAPPPVEPATAPVQVASPWPRLRRRFVMGGCAYDVSVRRWSRAFSENPARLEASLAEAMPYLLLVLDEIERRDLPGEFALLPYIESAYTPLASSGDHAAGIWQLMPDTAREAGLRIDTEYDGRLDTLAASAAALGLIERYAQEFADWRLADLAYNAGEFGVKTAAVTSRRPSGANDLRWLRLPPGAHDHLAKLLAISCVVADPARFHVELPEPTVDDLLVSIELPAPVDFALVTRLTGLELAELRRLNPAYLAAHMPRGGPYRLVLPETRRAALEPILARLPPARWRDWHEVTLAQAEPIGVLATAQDLEPAVLAAIHHVAADAVLPPGTRVLLPGNGDRVAAASPSRAATAPITPAGAIYVVRSGDTLWRIAEQRRVPLADLLRWNGLTRDTVLHLGQRLHLRDPQTTAIGGPPTGAGVR